MIFQRDNMLRWAGLPLTLSVLALLPALAPAMRIDVSPKVVVIDLFPAPTAIEITATIETPCDRLMLTIASTDTGPRELAYNERLGPIWLKQRRFVMTGAPTILMKGTVEIKDDGMFTTPQSVGRSELAEVRFDRRGFAMNDSLAAHLWREWEKNRRKEGLYRDDIAINFSKGGMRAKVELPAALKPGRIEIELVVERNGVEVGRGRSAVEVRPGGLVRWVERAAQERPLLYGILTSLAALSTGLAVGLIVRHKI